MDYEEFLSISDFIKPAMFSNPAGWRFHRCTQALRSSVLGDPDDQTAAAFTYAILGLKPKGTLEEIQSKVFSLEYVRREVMHTRERLAGRVPLYAGIATSPTPSTRASRKPRRNRFSRIFGPQQRRVRRGSFLALLTCADGEKRLVRSFRRSGGCRILR